MLMLPIILWWADAPLRFSLGRSRIVVSITITLAIMVASIMSPRVLAGDPLSGNESHSGALSSKASDQWLIQHHPNSQSELLREGTLVPVIDGRVMMLGRRWAFLPMVNGKALDSNQRDTHFTNHYETESNKRMSKANIVAIQPATAPSHLARKTNHHSSFFGKVRLISGPTRAIRTLTGSRGDAQATATDSTDQQKPWILVENLMLQRIVEAVRADNNDDRWSVSGKVVEFFGENRMVIQTAQRSNLK